MTPRTVLFTVAELLGWWIALGLLWLVLISTVDTLELAVGGGCAFVAAFVARGARRAVGGT